MDSLELKFEPIEDLRRGKINRFSRNRFTVYNWLADIPTPSLSKPFSIVEVSFQQGGRKDFYHNENYTHLSEGDMVVVEGSGGYDVGEITLVGELVRLQMRKKRITPDDPTLKRVLRPAGEKELEQLAFAQSLEKGILIKSREIAREQKLDMKITQIEAQADGKKITFYYTANSRVDFRELIKVYANEFKAKIEMRQIGSRQENAKVGGMDICGRELCNSTWLINAKPINISAVRYQGMPLNLNKITGSNGRLKCCFNFELDTYIDALKDFPKDADFLELEAGRATLQKKDIFKKLMWYSLPGSSKLYPLTLERVAEILEMNQNGEKPEGLGATELQTVFRIGESEERADMGFVNDVGQVSLNSLHKSKNKKSKHKNKGQDNVHKKEKMQAQGQPSIQNVVKPPKAVAEGRQNNKGKKGGNRGNKKNYHGSKPQGNRPNHQNNASQNRNQE